MEVNLEEEVVWWKRRSNMYRILLCLVVVMKLDSQLTSFLSWWVALLTLKGGGLVLEEKVVGWERRSDMYRILIQWEKSLSESGLRYRTKICLGSIQSTQKWFILGSWKLRGGSRIPLGIVILLGKTHFLFIKARDQSTRLIAIMHPSRVASAENHWLIAGVKSIVCLPLGSLESAMKNVCWIVLYRTRQMLLTVSTVTTLEVKHF